MPELLFSKNFDLNFLQRFISLQSRYYFKPDGTFVEIDGGYRFNGTWYFTDNTAAVLFLDFKTWTETCTITNFTSNHLNYTEPMGYHALSFTELIPVQ